MKSKLKKVWVSLIIITCMSLAFEATHSAKYWQTERITVTGEQIAKRLENTKYGDRFYLLMNTQYGVMEIPVSYGLYIQYSNDEIHSLRIKLLTANNALENTSKLQQAYPFLKHFGYHIAVWILGVTLGMLTLVASVISTCYCTDKDEAFDPRNPTDLGFAIGLPLVILMGILGLIL